MKLGREYSGRFAQHLKIERRFLPPTLLQLRYRSRGQNPSTPLPLPRATSTMLRSSRFFRSRSPVRAAIFLCQLGVLSAVALTSGCFIETKAAANFRYSCDKASQCEDGSTCAQGLCQIACTGASADNLAGSCPADGGYVACINGYCANICDPSRKDCPGSQACLAIPGSETGGAGQSAAVCAVACDPATLPCPNAETCLAGFCVPTSSQEQTTP